MLCMHTTTDSRGKKLFETSSRLSPSLHVMGNIWDFGRIQMWVLGYLAVPPVLSFCSALCASAFPSESQTSCPANSGGVASWDAPIRVPENLCPRSCSHLNGFVGTPRWGYFSWAVISLSYSQQCQCQELLYCPCSLQGLKVLPVANAQPPWLLIKD